MKTQYLVFVLLLSALSEKGVAQDTTGETVAERTLRGKGSKKDQPIAEIQFEDGSNVKWYDIDGDVITEVEATDKDPEQLAFLQEHDEDPVVEFKRLSRNSKAPVPPGLGVAWERVRGKGKPRQKKEKTNENNGSGRSLASSHDLWWQSNYCSNPANHNALVDCRCYTHLRSNTGPHTMDGAHIHTAVYNIGDSTNSIGYKLEKEKRRCFIWCWHDGWTTLTTQTVPKGWVYWSWSYGNRAKRRSRTFGATGQLYDYSANACSDILESVDKSVCRNPDWINF